MGCLDDQKMIEKSRYLHLMGVQQWVRRDIDSAAVAEIDDDFSHQLEESGAAGSPLLIVTTHLESEERKLLGAMLQAIGLGVEQIQQIIITDSSLLSQPRFQHHLCGRIDQIAPRIVLQLGGDTLQHDLVEFTHHPSHLLHHPSDKRHAWEALKRVQQHLDG